nr:RNA-directed DNA polymerase, eukaryota [Tanacetum cinerariifolium]
MVARIIGGGGSGRWVWSIESSGEFSVKSARALIDDFILPAVGSSTRWAKTVPIKVNIFTWKVCLDRFPTRLNLSLRGIDIPCISCPICSSAGESCAHLLFSCSMAKEVARWCEMEIPVFYSYEDWLNWFISLRFSKAFKDMLEGIFFVMWWCDGNITTLVHVLECFYRASGLRINMSKSKIMGVLVDNDKVKCDALKLECLILKTPFSYLGSKVGGSMSWVHTWNEVVDRVKNRLSKWKMKTLSIGGRLTLRKSVLGSMPIFHMSIFRAPLTVLRTLESIRSQFFKGQELNSKKASWAIHGDDEKVGGYVKNGAKSCWLSIVNEINSLKNKGINLLDFMHVKLGNRDKTTFWDDIWIEGKALKNRYPRIYSLETCKLITVGMKLAQTSLDSSFRRVPRGGVEQEQ